MKSSLPRVLTLAGALRKTAASQEGKNPYRYELIYPNCEGDHWSSCVSGWLVDAKEAWQVLTQEDLPRYLATVPVPNLEENDVPRDFIYFAAKYCLEKGLP